MAFDRAMGRGRFSRLFARTRKWLSMRIYPEQVLLRSAAANSKYKVSKAQQTFETTSREWFRVKIVDEKKGGRTRTRELHLIDVLNRQIGPRPIAEIEPPDVLAAIRPYMIAGYHETASRIRSTASRVFRYGVACGYCPRDMAADLKGALTAPQATARPALLEANAVGELMRRIDRYPGRSRVVRPALQFLALTFVRPGEVRSAEWSEFDLNNSVWLIPAAKMKMRRPHAVPLSRQASDLIFEVQKVTGGRRYASHVQLLWRSQDALNNPAILCLSDARCEPRAFQR